MSACPSCPAQVVEAHRPAAEPLGQVLGARSYVRLATKIALDARAPEVRRGQLAGLAGADDQHACGR